MIFDCDSSYFVISMFTSLIHSCYSESIVGRRKSVYLYPHLTQLAEWSAVET